MKAKQKQKSKPNAWVQKQARLLVQIFKQAQLTHMEASQLKQAIAKRTGRSASSVNLAHYVNSRILSVEGGNYSLT